MKQILKYFGVSIWDCQKVFNEADADMIYVTWMNQFIFLCGNHIILKFWAIENKFWSLNARIFVCEKLYLSSSLHLMTL